VEEGILMFLTTSAMAKCMPPNVNFIVCGKAAARMLGVADGRPPLWVYMDKDPLWVGDVSVLRVDDLARVPYINSGVDGLKITSPGKTIADLLKWENINTGPAVEAIARYLDRCEIGDWDRDEEELTIKREGMWDKYCEVVPLAQTFFEY
jgi:hypothetical protein